MDGRAFVWKATARSTTCRDCLVDYHSKHLIIAAQLHCTSFIESLDGAVIVQTVHRYLSTSDRRVRNRHASARYEETATSPMTGAAVTLDTLAKPSMHARLSDLPSRNRESATSIRGGA